MPSWRDEARPLRIESHFGDRLVRCFAERPAGLNEMLAAAVARNADGEALIDGELRLTWRALDDCVAHCAAGLARRGVGRGDRVALLLGNRSEFVVAWLAAARLGAIVVPLSIRAQAAELDYMLGHCSAAVVVHEADLAGRLPAAPRRIAVGAGVDSEAFAALYGDGRVDTVAASSEEGTAAILYTSGTTGRPKGAMLTHLGIVHSAMHYADAMRLTEADRSVAAVPLSHVTGVIALMATMICCAGTLVLLREFKAPSFIELAARERMTHTVLVPAMFNLCLLAPEFDRVDLSAWRIGGYGGAPMPPATIARCAQKLPRLELMNLYGATETTSPATIMPARYSASHADSVGLPVACADIVVMDDSGRAVPAGKTGELWIGGPMVVRGYWDDAQATAREFTGGYWHSGDIGSIDADGFVRVFDRSKDMINRGGYKIYSAEVESVLIAHPAVIEAAVVAKPCPVLGERVHAFVCVREDASAESLRAHCAAQLADYKVPETFSLGREPLPRNANGKLLKRLLRQQASAGEPA
jgi:acyl-CoA synthetase (AMP-forming)/AMP-acid ligase II